MARPVRAREIFGLEALITDDYLEVEAKFPSWRLSLFLEHRWKGILETTGYSMCSHLRASHVQDFPARYSPQMGRRVQM